MVVKTNKKKEVKEILILLSLKLFELPPFTFKLP